MNDKLDSLITLLDDPDDSVFSYVLDEMVKLDVSTVDRLEHIWETSFDDLVQKRIELIIQKIQQNDTRAKIRNWSTQKHLDLFEGMFLIARYQYPELKLKTIQTKIENIRKDVWIEFRNSLTSLEKVTILNHIFFDHYKFKIDKNNEDLPQHCFINRILETHRGNPVSIAILYTLIARMLNLPVQYIDFEKNPLIGYFDKDMAQLVHGENCQHQVLFFINPANKGAIIGLKEVAYIQHSEGLLDNDKLTKPCSDKTVIKRLIEKLAYAYSLEGQNIEKVFYLNEIADML